MRARLCEDDDEDAPNGGLPCVLGELRVLEAAPPPLKAALGAMVEAADDLRLPARRDEEAWARDGKLALAGE